MILLREPPPSRMRKLRAKIHVTPRARPEHELAAQPLEDCDAETQQEEVCDEDRLAESLRGTFPASDPPSSWAG